MKNNQTTRKKKFEHMESVIYRAYPKRTDSYELAQISKVNSNNTYDVQVYGKFRRHVVAASVINILKIKKITKPN